MHMPSWRAQGQLYPSRLPFFISPGFLITVAEIAAAIN